jgi:hypothetical protein
MGELLIYTIFITLFGLIAAIVFWLFGKSEEQEEEVEE